MSLLFIGTSTEFTQNCTCSSDVSVNVYDYCIIERLSQLWRLYSSSIPFKQPNPHNEIGTNTYALITPTCFGSCAPSSRSVHQHLLDVHSLVTTYQDRNPSQYTEHTGVTRIVLCKRKCKPLQETNNVKIYDSTFNRSSLKFTFNNRPQNASGLFCPFVAPNYRFCVYYFTPFRRSQ
jgi:hypothetical protein